MRHHTSTVAALLGCLWIAAFVTPAVAEHRSATTIPTAALIQPADFAALLQRSKTHKPLILQVGFRKAYEQAHIPQAEYAGAAGEEDGVSALKNRVATVTKDSAIVIYCGCCPWERCPNIAAAYDALLKLGFTNVRVIYIADDFGTDWVEKGYPTTHGS